MNHIKLMLFSSLCIISLAISASSTVVNSSSYNANNAIFYDSNNIAIGAPFTIPANGSMSVPANAVSLGFGESGRITIPAHTAFNIFTQYTLTNNIAPATTVSLVYYDKDKKALNTSTSAFSVAPNATIPILVNAARAQSTWQTSEALSNGGTKVTTHTAQTPIKANTSRNIAKKS